MEDKFKYNDIGVILGEEILKIIEEKQINLKQLSETIGATVVGAGNHTTEISGSTITYSEGIFPIKNIPVLKLTEEDESAKGIELEEIIKRKLEWFNLKKEDKRKRLYGEYLKLRFRPAVELLIKKKENKKLTELIKEQEADENLLNSFLKTAVQYGNQEAQIFLLQEKEALGGFQEKSWEL